MRRGQDVDAERREVALVQRYDRQGVGFGGPGNERIRHPGAVACRDRLGFELAGNRGNCKVNWKDAILIGRKEALHPSAQIAGFRVCPFVLEQRDARSISWTVTAERKSTLVASASSSQERNACEGSVRNGASNETTLVSRRYPLKGPRPARARGSVQTRRQETS